MTTVHRELTAFCRRRGLRAPSRSTLYNAIERIPPPTFDKRDLPEHVLRTLHNVGPGPIPGHHVAFAAFNYGQTQALSWAASMPWLCLHHALRLHGWRPKSRSLAHAIALARGIHVEPTPSAD